MRFNFPHLASSRWSSLSAFTTAPLSATSLQLILPHQQSLMQPDLPLSLRSTALKHAHYLSRPIHALHRGQNPSALSTLSMTLVQHSRTVHLNLMMTCSLRARGHLRTQMPHMHTSITVAPVYFVTASSAACLASSSPAASSSRNRSCVVTGICFSPHNRESNRVNSLRTHFETVILA